MKAFQGNKKIRRAVDALADLMVAERAAGRYDFTYTAIYSVTRTGAGQPSMSVSEFGCLCADCRAGVAMTARIKCDEAAIPDSGAMVH